MTTMMVMIMEAAQNIMHNYLPCPCRGILTLEALNELEQRRILNLQGCHGLWRAFLLTKYAILQSDDDDDDGRSCCCLLACLLAACYCL